MSDARLRELERTWRTSGSLEDEIAYLSARLRSGDIDVVRLRLAVHLGHEAAYRALDEVPPDLPLKDTLRGLHGWGREACSRAAVALVRLALARRIRPHSRDDLTWTALLSCEAYLAAPTPERHRAAVDAGLALDRELTRTYPHPDGLDAYDHACAAGLPVAEAAARATTAKKSTQINARALELAYQYCLRIVQTDLSLGGYEEDHRVQCDQLVLGAVREDLVPWMLGYGDPLTNRRPKPTGDRLRLAAYLGDADTRASFGKRIAPPIEDLEEWIGGLLPWGREPCVRAAVAAARAVLSGWQPIPGWSEAEETIGAAEEWLACPCAAHTAKADDLGAGASTADLIVTDPAAPAMAAMLAAESVVHAEPAQIAWYAVQTASRVSDPESIRAAIRDALVPWALGVD